MVDEAATGVTPADRCCGTCRSLAQCRRRCGVEAAPAEPVEPAPGLSARGLFIVDVLAWLSFAALVAVPLRLCGAI